VRVCLATGHDCYGVPRSSLKSVDDKEPFVNVIAGCVPTLKNYSHPSATDTIASGRAFYSRANKADYLINELGGGKSPPLKQRP